jgi:hypothetical protein
MAHKLKRTAASGKRRNKTQRNALRARKRVNFYRGLSNVALRMRGTKDLRDLQVLKFEKDMIVAQLQRMEHN